MQKHQFSRSLISLEWIVYKTILPPTIPRRYLINPAQTDEYTDRQARLAFPLPPSPLRLRRPCRRPLPDGSSRARPSKRFILLFRVCANVFSLSLDLSQSAKSSQAGLARCHAYFPLTPRNSDEFVRESIARPAC